VIGKTIAHYEILDKLGEGGMGVVYRARDKRLGRDVAVKVLPEQLARDRERMARFEREAHVLAQLNHPNISSIYGLERSDGQFALVMELVDGPTLADRLDAGPIPMDEALPMARQIAEALSAAHEKGIIHRDLKPANIKIDGEGNVKVLDFGLAKALEADASTSQPEDSPTLTLAATQAGVILGTAAYMSPEQARGRPVDKRADIWAFGVVLYEMLTGRQLFGGETVSDSLAGVLKTEIDLGALPEGTPWAVRRLLLHCLERDRKRRLHDIADAVLEIDDAAVDDNTGAAIVQPAPVWRVAGMGFALLAALIVITVMWLRWPTRELPLRKSVLSADNAQFPVISPDGKHIVYVGGKDRDSLWVQDLDRTVPREIPNTDGATYPFWSPDSDFIGFGQVNVIKKVPLAGGVASTICDLETGTYWGGTWSADGEQIAVTSVGGLYSVPARGGSATLEQAAGTETSYDIIVTPHFLPSRDNPRILLFAGRTSGGYGVMIHDLDTGRSELLTKGTRPVYSPSGHILFQRSTEEDAVWAVPFLAEELRVAGEPFPVAEGASRPSVAKDGTLIHATGAGWVRMQLVWRDRSGNKFTTLGVPQSEIRGPRLSPDESLVAVMAIGQSQSAEVWTHGVAQDSVGINRHRVADERAVQERSSDPS
jgi:eukaryotic-like serine/threonine-protein kinase